MTRKPYTAHYRFEDGDWIVEVDEIPQVHTFATSLAKAQAHIREALALWLQVEDTTSLSLDERYEGLPENLLDVVAQANAARAQASELSDRAQQLTASPARSLIVDLGMSGRGAARLLGVSHQRVHQLVHQDQARSA
ncbi:MAG TPA: type II toxin-antitoxin system HicB family antitoxin [Acidimicrobiales bacterium]|nr:type II toxin-antitoxin system HicB family antitoxin [Acidimicrobiales bacterium]